MKAKVAIALYSGSDLDPELNLSEEQQLEILIRIANLTEPFLEEDQDNWFLGTYYYILSWSDHPYALAVYFNPNGCINILKKDGSSQNFNDTVGLHTFLTELLAPVLSKHIEDSQVKIDKYFEDLAINN